MLLPELQEWSRLRGLWLLVGLHATIPQAALLRQILQLQTPQPARQGG